MSYRFYIADVFGEEKYSGNRLAVFLNAGSIPAEEMQKIALEINFAETTFIMSDDLVDGGYCVRIFTPESEIDFAGHPTLGTAHIIQKHIIKKPVDKVILNLKVGQVPVEFKSTEKGNVLWMKQVQPKFGKILEPKDVADVIGLNTDDIDPEWPIEEVSTGLPHLIVPLKNMDALKRVSVSQEKYYKLIDSIWGKVLLVFCGGGYSKEEQIGVRVFPIYLGVPEDPATGSGNGCLAAYLVKHRYFNSDSIDLISGQGYEIKRPSSLYLRASKVAEEYDIQVGGKVVDVAEGLWG